MTLGCGALGVRIADATPPGMRVRIGRLIQDDRLVGGIDAVLVVKDTAMPKNGAIERRKATSLKDILANLL
jgi:hypothetical protein